MRAHPSCQHHQHQHQNPHPHSPAPALHGCPCMEPRERSVQAIAPRRRISVLDCRRAPTLARSVHKAAGWWRRRGRSAGERCACVCACVWLPRAAMHALLESGNCVPPDRLPCNCPTCLLRGVCGEGAAGADRTTEIPGDEESLRPGFRQLRVDAPWSTRPTDGQLNHYHQLASLREAAASPRFACTPAHSHS